MSHELTEAENLLLEAKQLSDAVPNRGLGIAIIGLGRLSLMNGRIDDAGRYFATALEYAVDIGRRMLVCEALEVLAFVAEQGGDAATSVRLLATTDAQRLAMYGSRAPDYRGRVEAAEERLRNRLGDLEYRRMEGRRPSLAG